MANAFAQLLEKTSPRRDEFDRLFAASLPVDQPDGRALIPIEEALERCLAPAAVAGRILLIVVDGMSIPVFLELHHSLIDQGWVQCQRRGGEVSTLLPANAPIVPADPVPPRGAR